MSARRRRAVRRGRDRPACPVDLRCADETVALWLARPAPLSWRAARPAGVSTSRFGNV